MSDRIKKILESLTPEQRALVERRMLAKRGFEEHGSSIPRRSDRRRAPLSFAQQRMWFLEQLVPGNPAHHIADAFLIESNADESALRRSLNELVKRHESLRTTFTVVDGEPVQVVADALEVDLPVVRVPAGAAGDHTEARRILIEESGRPFDLGQGPLLRAKLVVIGERSHVLVLTMHHIISDAWSRDVFLRELLTLYGAFREGRTASLPDLPIQYADFATWQRTWLEGERLDGQMAYWKRQLENVPTLQLPTDHPRPALLGNRGGHADLVLPERLCRAMRGLCREEGVTVFMLMLAVLDVLLQRYSGQDDVVVGSPVASRNREELEGVIGFFVNMLVMRADLADDPSCRELLARVREVTLSAQEHQDVPFEKLVDELDPVRDMSRSPLFQVAYEYRKFEPQTDGSVPLKMRPVSLDLETTRFDLEVHVWERGEDLGVVFVYRTDLFEGSTVERMLSHFHRLLDGMVSSPDRRISETPLLIEDEARRVLVEWNDTDQPFPDDRCIHQIFEEQVRRTPEADAAVFEDDRLTYRELNRRANNLAHFLIGEGVGPDVMVGICAERGLEMVVGILGILKAGGAYVPLDPGYPQARLAFMLNDSGVPIVLTQEHLLEELPQHRAHVHCLDRDWPVIAEQPDADPPCAAGPETLAYVIYTSGSTGTPKGTLLRHRGLCNLSQEQATAFGVGPGSRVLQFSSLSFDASTFDIMMALPKGGTLYLGRRESIMPGPDLLHFLRRHAINIVTLPPTALAALPVEELPDLETITVAGEACSSELVSRWAPGRRFFNLYGPTEATIWSTTAELDEETTPHIGRPVGNVEIYIVDGQLRPVPVGVAGEILIGGVGLARGYVGRPALTAERFVPHPFRRSPGARLYRTGDLARYRADGTIEFIGRIDDQVKIRGFRIELGEVEAALRRHPAVDNAVVIGREDEPGDKRLVAYLVSAGDGPSAGEIVRFLREHLPAHMIPHVFVTLDVLPQNPSGKVDRRRLPKPGSHRPQVTARYEAPRTDAEVALAGIWANLLRVDRVGRYDNFFELGGDSILAIQIITRAKQTGLHLAPRDIFDHQTVADLAAASSSSSLVVETGPVVGVVPLTPIQHWFFALETPDPSHFNQAVVLSVARSLEASVLRDAVAALVDHHDMLRARFRQGTDGWSQTVVAPDGEVPFEVVVLADLAVDDQSAAVTAHAEALQAGLDLASGPVLRVAMFDLGPDRPGRIVFVIHHLVVDGVSWRILLEDFKIACEQRLAGQPIDLGPRTTSFRRWAEELVERAASGDRAGDLAYWRNLPWDKVPSLPTDGSGGVGTVGDAAEVSLALDATETRRLLQEVPRTYRTQINDVLLTALGCALEPWTGSSTMIVDLEGHGRDVLLDGVDVSRTVGWFTALFPVVLDLGNNRPHVGAALMAVKEQLRAVPERGSIFGLERYLAPREPDVDALQETPRAEIAFNYLGQFDQILDRQRILGPGAESAGADQGPSTPRPHLLEINCSVNGGRLRVTWRFNPAAHDHDTIRAVAERYLEAVRTITEHCAEIGTGQYTPSDFPLADLNTNTLDQIENLYELSNIEDVYALTPMQIGMLYHTLRDENRSDYLQQMRITLDGWDAPVFLAAWERVIDRHDVLRTSIVGDEAATFAQVVHRSVTPLFEEHDLRGLEEDPQEAHIREYLQADREQGFDLTRPPLVRFALFRRAEHRYELVWSFHHIILDGWSLPILIREVYACYEGLRAGEEPELSRPDAFRDYVAWLRRQDQSRADAYWRERLEGFDGPTSFAPRIGMPGEVTTYGVHEVSLPQRETEPVRGLAASLQVTINTVVVAAWSFLMARYTGTDDVLFGTTVSGRPPDIPNVESTVGLFVNTLATRVRVPRWAPLGSWLRTIQQDQLEQRDYEYSPLWRVQQVCDRPRGMPLFDTLLVFENYPVSVMTPADHRGPAMRMEMGTERTGYPLTLSVAARDGLYARLTYDKELFDEDMMDRMGRQLVRTLEAMASDPSQRVSELSLLSEDERHRLVVEWNDTAAAYPGDRCLHELFETQVERTPDATAVVFEDSELSYQELNGQANQVAHHLRSMGVGSETMVGICAERSLELVVGLLGILKAGAAYVPLDPGYPRDRLEFMLEDARTPVVLVQDRLADTLGDYPGRVVLLDGDRDAIALQSTANPRAGTRPENLAYTIYTSGSTGRPKGAMNQHSGICNRLQWIQEVNPLTDADRVMQKTPFSFDVSVWEFFWPLVSGARLVLARPGGHKDPEYLVRTIEAQGITTIHFVPSMLRAFLETPDLAPARGLRRVLCSGEALPYDLQERFFERLDAELHNLYGPTEAAVEVTAWTCRRDAVDRTVPIGRPVANTAIYILDTSIRPVPIGVPGELYIGGIQVARGYWDRPGLTARSFVPDPFDEQPGSRLYRTGDLARFRPDGSIEFLGRLDHQVKLRGFRIELGEIETVLCRHPQIRDAVVIVRDEATGEDYLAAYTVPAGTDVPDTAELREHLLASLPDYMVPSVFVGLDAIPFTPSGKIDRRALPAPQGDRRAGGAYVAPRSDLEERIAAIWRAVLNVDQVGCHDNFYELGGDSILGIQIVARANDAGMRLPLRELYERQTIAGLAAAVDSGRHIEAEQGPVMGDVLLTPIQRWFFERDLTEAHHFNQVRLLSVLRPVTPDTCEQALKRLLDHHDALRMRFHFEDGSWRQVGGDPGSKVAFTYVDLSGVPAAEQSKAITARAGEFQASLGLTEGPLLRAAWFDLGADRPARLLIVIHHLAVDGVSWWILLDDLRRVCEQLGRGRDVQLPPKTTSFQEWARRLEDHAQSPSTEGELEYWLGLPWEEVVDLPVDHDAGASTVASSAHLVVTLSEDETRDLLQEVPRAHNTEINDVLLAAMVQSFARWTGRMTALVDLEGHGREDLFEDVDTSRTVGWFTSLFPVLLDLSGTRDAGADPGTILKIVKEQLRAIPHRGLGYGVLRHLHADPAVVERLHQLPRPQVSFNYLGQLDAMYGEEPMFGPASESPGPAVGPRNVRSHLIDVVGMVVEGRLRINWVYDSTTHDRETIERLAEDYVFALRRIIEHCRSMESREFTPSDFPLANLDDDELGRLAALIENEE